MSDVNPSGAPRNTVDSQELHDSQPKSPATTTLAGSQKKRAANSGEPKKKRARQTKEEMAAARAEEERMRQIKDAEKEKKKAKKEKKKAEKKATKKKSAGSRAPGRGAGLYDNSSEEDDSGTEQPEDPKRSNSPEVFYSDWVPTQDEAEHQPSQVESDGQEKRNQTAAETLIPDVVNNLDELPPPLDFPPLVSRTDGGNTQAQPNVMDDRVDTSRRDSSEHLSPQTPRNPVCRQKSQSIPPSTSASESTQTRRQRFPNQRAGNATREGPPKEASSKSKMSSVAGAFGESSEQRFGFLDNHMSWEKEKYGRIETKEKEIFSWEKEKDERDHTEAKGKAARELKWEKQKYN
ncbi:hypothetical protein PtA15_1A751 [Puccinia triticina]|uniref:Uncharacterized protein n=1 Tax=Puccinia triticina TaxID=208348 RepID=A0ABY7CC12_9BASI|nr:uncharacterized protein PtA15_1A751 [Puccinia triticina]WAQ81410.1 hypothetical protein PtA15_1A751 [Puccinia triticina]